MVAMPLLLQTNLGLLEDFLAFTPPADEEEEDSSGDGGVLWSRSLSPCIFRLLVGLPCLPEPFLASCIKEKSLDNAFAIEPMSFLSPRP